MDSRIRNLFVRLSLLEDEAQSLIENYHQNTGAKKIVCEASATQTNPRLKKSLISMMLNNRPQNLITGPIIYSMILPLLVFDLFISFYHASCFPIYRIEKVRRKDYIVFDRQRLVYLNFIEKFHCIYCAYGAGLIAYAGEIVGRTEEYFCPIKHAQKIAGRHAHYAHFLEYGDAADIEERLEAFRIRLASAQKESSD